MSSAAADPDPEPAARPGGGARAAGDAVLAVAALVVAAAGGGVGLRHLTRGLSVTAVVGLALLATGLVLLVVSLRRLWRRTHGWGRLWVVAAVPLAVLLAWPAAIGPMVAFVPTTPVADGEPASASLALRDVDVPARDGVLLAGSYASGTNGAAVVLLHGAGSNRTATVAQAEVLGRNGYGVLLLDASGHGDSGGRGMDLGWHGDRDVQAALDLLAQQDGVDRSRLALLGLSMGGEQAIGAAAADPRVRAVVAEGATARTAEDKATWLPGGLAGGVQRDLDRLTDPVVELLTPAPRPISLGDAVAGSDTRFLLVTGGAVPDEARAAAALQARAPDRVQVWTVPGGGHTDGLQTDPEGWEERVVAFLDEHLGVERPDAVVPEPGVGEPGDAPAGGTPDPGADAADADLADGRHAARLVRVDAASRTATLDVVQLLVGEAAAAAAQEDGAQEVPPPNDYWIRNSSDRLRTLPVATDAEITVNTLVAAETGSSTQDVAVPLPRLATFELLDQALFWVTVEDGTVVGLREQYLP